MLKRASKILLNSGSFFVLTLALISGCGDSAKKESSPAASTEATGTVLCKIDGKPVINESEFNNNINQMLQSNPYFKGAGAQGLPASIKRKFFDELVKQELIIVDAAKSNLDQDAEFKKSLEDMQKLVKRSLTVQFFEKRIYDGIVVEDSEVTKHFEENKERYVKNAGGVLVGAVRFESDRNADAFLEKAESVSSYGDFEKMAKDKNAQFRSFGRVNKQDTPRGYQLESVPAQIKDAALGAKSLPATLKVKAGKDIWVIHASDKRESEMFDLAEIKPQIVNMIKNNKFKEKLDQAITELKSKASVEVNEDFFKEKAQPAHEHSEDDGHGHSAAEHQAANPAVGA